MSKKSKQFLSATVIVAILLTVTTQVFALTPIESLVSVWTPIESPPYALEYAKSANGVSPFLVEGEKGNFGDSIPDINNFKKDTSSGDFMSINDENKALLEFSPDEDDSSVKIRVWLSKNSDGKLYIESWESDNMQVHYVITKGGPNFFVYQYEEKMDSDSDLMNPKVGSQFENMSSLSNFSIYWTSDTDVATDDTDVATDVIDATSDDTDATSEDTDTTSEDTDATSDDTDATSDDTDATSDDTEATSDYTDATSGVNEELTITNETIPLGDPKATTTDETMEAITQESIQITDEQIPQTGQTANSVIIGATLLALSASLFFIVRRKRKCAV